MAGRVGIVPLTAEEKKGKYYLYKCLAKHDDCNKNVTQS
jgi:hypothetical protein